MKTIITTVGLCILFVLGSMSVFAAPDIFGDVWDSGDGELANGYTVVMWLPANGKTTNTTDTIGPTGGCGVDNCWMANCYNPNGANNDCELGDVVNVEVVEENGYTSVTGSFTITSDMISLGWGESPALTLTANEPPNLTIHSPVNNTVIADTYKVNVTAKNLTLLNVSTVLYSIGNESGNYSKDGSSGWSELSRQEGTYYYDDTFDTTLFANANYSLYVLANNTLGTSATIFHNITIQNPPDLMVNDSSLSFSTDAPYEGENITISATVYNTGAQRVANALVRFYAGSAIAQNQIDVDKTVSLEGGGSNSVSVTYLAPLGTTNISVYVDPLDSISEGSEANNVANLSLYIPSYHIITGNFSGKFIIADGTGNTMTSWIDANVSGSHIYVADSDSSINFYQLQALGRDVFDVAISDDFANADAMMNLTNFTDSVNKTYTSLNSPKHTTSFDVFGFTVDNVPYTNSTNTSLFHTNVFWDTSDDLSANDQFDTIDNEDLVFATMVRDPAQGTYGFYSYEIRVPSGLNRYNKEGTDGTVSVYAEVK